MKLKKNKCYFNGDVFTEYLGSYFWSESTMKHFGTRNTYHKIVTENLTPVGIQVYNSKAPKGLQNVYYAFYEYEGEKTTKCFYDYDECKEFIRQNAFKDIFDNDPLGLLD